jgi:signal transduction histidine kinase/HAMP domain-containing protein
MLRARPNQTRPHGDECPVAAGLPQPKLADHGSGSARRWYGKQYCLPARLSSAVRDTEAIIEIGPTARSGTRQGRLLRKYAIVFGALVGGTLVLGSLVQLTFSYQESQTALLQKQSVEASRAALRISQFVDTMKSHVVATLPPPGLGNVSCEHREAEFLQLQRRASQINDVSFIDRAGKEQAFISRLALNRTCHALDRSTDLEFVRTRTGTPYFSPVEFRNGSEPYFRIAIPDAKDAGVTVATVNLRFVLDPVSSIKPLGSAAGHAYVVDSAGFLIAHPDISLVLRLTDLSALPQVKAAVAAGTVTQQAMTATSQDGRPVLTAFEVIPATGWAVFVEQPLDEAFASLTASLWRAGGILALGLAISLVASLYLSRRMVEPIEAIRAGASRIAAGALDQRIAIDSGDELSDLADEFNEMGRRLGESYATLEQKVVDRTRDVGEALDRQTAIAEVLKRISRSTFDLQPVLQIVIENAARLVQADIAWMSRVEGESFQTLAYSSGFPVDLRAEIAAERERAGIADGWTSATMSGGLISAVVRLRSTLHVPDAKADAMFGHSRVVQSTASRTVLGVPMLREGEVIGAMVLARYEVRPFSEREIELVQTFADQAAIAIENVRLFNEIEEKRRELELASKNKSDFLANMSHELRTPLNAIIGFSELLLEKMFGELTPKQAEYVRDILSSGKHQLAVINDVLDLSKVEAGRLDLQRSTFSLSIVVSDAVAFVRARATQRGIALAERVDASVGEIDADARKVKQVLVNLLSNAVKFTPDGGRVEVHGTRQNGEVTISVRDTGAGMASDELSMIFKEFGQTASARGHEGTGLGLALTKRLVELHGGHIWVESKLGEGSMFTFALPSWRQQSAELPDGGAPATRRSE